MTFRSLNVSARIVFDHADVTPQFGLQSVDFIHFCHVNLRSAERGRGSLPQVWVRGGRPGKFFENCLKMVHSGAFWGS